MSNPALQRLGLPSDARVAIVHADDIGMCHAANLAFKETLPFGILTCGAIMMPCPWVPELAAWCRAHPGVDMGVHITLNCEWNEYRWPPLSTRDPKSGLIDEEGYMWRSVPELHRHMDPDAAIAEMRAQIERALALGIDVTHVDTHMGAVAHPILYPALIQLALEFRLPAMLPRLSEQGLARWGIGPELGRQLLARFDQLMATGYPVLNGILAAREQGDHLEVYRRLFDLVPPGITHLLLHPSAPRHDIEAITDSAAYRIADYRVLMRPELKQHIATQGIHLIGYRALRDLIRGN